MATLTVSSLGGALVHPAVKRKIDEIGDETLPDQQRMASIVDIAVPLLTYFELNEEREDLHSKRIKDLRAENEDLEKELAEAKKVIEDEEAVQKKLAEQLEENRILDEKREILRKKARRSGKRISSIWSLHRDRRWCIVTLFAGPGVGIPAGSLAGTLTQQNCQREWQKP